MMQLSNPGLMRYTPKAISDGVRKQLLDVIGGMGNITGSAISGTINQAVSGTTEDYAIGLVSAYETE